MKLPFTQNINNKPNFFIQKIWQGLLDNNIANNDDYLKYKDFYKSVILGDWNNKLILKPKLHTIRIGQRWSVGMSIEFVIETLNHAFFNFAPQLPCIAVQNIEISYATTFQVSIDGKILGDSDIKTLAINDGFEDIDEFKSYFNKDFNGQIIHWTSLTY